MHHSKRRYSKQFRVEQRDTNLETNLRNVDIQTTRIEKRSTCIYTYAICLTWTRRLEYHHRSLPPLLDGNNSGRWILHERNWAFSCQTNDVSRTTFSPSLLFPSIEVVWREPIFMVHSQRTNCLVFLSRDRELSPRGGSMVVTWSFFIGCDLHVATLSEIGRTSYMYIFLDGDILHDGIALYLSSLSPRIQFFR